jgi:hypothetical protein
MSGVTIRQLQAKMPDGSLTVKSSSRCHLFKSGAGLKILKHWGIKDGPQGPFFDESTSPSFTPHF